MHLNSFLQASLELFFFLAALIKVSSWEDHKILEIKVERNPVNNLDSSGDRIFGAEEVRNFSIANQHVILAFMISLSVACQNENGKLKI